MPKTTTFDTTTVLQQATEVFHIKGYHGTSMQDLVDATGLNRSSIYNSFGCKLQLYLETLKNYRQVTNRKFTKSLVKSENALDSIRTILELYIIEMLNDKDNKGCFIVNCISEMANQELEITKLLYHNQEENLKLFEDLIQMGQQEEVLNRKQDPKSYALYLFSSIQGLRMTGVLTKEKGKLQGIVDAIIQTIT